VARPSARSGFRELVAGSSETIAGTVYGTIIVMATLVAGAAAFRDDLWHLLAIVVVTTLVFWAAHIYAHGLAESLQLGRRITRSELAQIAHRERAMGLAVVLPAAALVIGALGVIDGSVAIWLALGLGVAALAAQGVRYARLERLSTAGTAVVVGLNLVLGLSLVLLKVIVVH
jgi:positive regulator of sigma E activity